MCSIELQPKRTYSGQYSLMGDDRTMAVQEELTSLLDSALRMGEVNGGAEWSNALLFDDVLRRPKDDGSSRGDITASTTENTTSSEDATKWRFDTARRLGTVSLYICYVIFIFGLHDVKSCIFSNHLVCRILCTTMLFVFRIFFVPRCVLLC